MTPLHTHPEGTPAGNPVADARSEDSVEKRPTVSYLVRFWLEPRENEEEAALRGYVRDLRTGEEHYYSDPRRLGELILRRLRNARRRKAGRDEPHEKRSGLAG